MEKHFIVYKTTNTVNGKIYIGAHSTYNLNDGYKGSGKHLKKAFKKYGKENFKTEIICRCTNEEVMFKIESFFVNKLIDNFGQKGHYNRAYGGKGAALGENNHFYGKSHTDETRKLISEKLTGLMVGEDNPFYGKTHTEQSITKIKENRDLNVETNLTFRNGFVNKSKWWWCTPWGCFYSSRYASDVNGGHPCKATIEKRCRKSDEVIPRHNQVSEDYWGKSWREIGYYRIGK